MFVSGACMLFFGVSFNGKLWKCVTKALQGTATSAMFIIAWILWCYRKESVLQGQKSSFWGDLRQACCWSALMCSGVGYRIFINGRIHQCLHKQPWRFAFQHLITWAGRWRGRGRAMFSMTRSLPFRDACLLKGFIYHKAASRWLGRLHRNVSGTLEWINFLCFAKLIMTESQSRVNPYISGLIPTICQWYCGPFQCDTLQLSFPTYMLFIVLLFLREYEEDHS